MYKKIAAIVAFATLALPLVASAQALQPLQNLISSLNVIVYKLVPLLMGIALVVFFWGLVRYIWGSKGEIDQEKGKKVMVAGLAALFIMASVWGIIALAQSALGVPQNVTPSVPAVPHG